MIEQTKLISGKYKYPVTLITCDGRIYFKFAFNRGLLEEVKSFQGSKWHDYEGAQVVPKDVLAVTGSRKVWSVLDNHRNRFQLEFLKGNNPYGPWDTPLLDVPILPRERSDGKVVTPYTHQGLMTRCIITYHYWIGAAEMGTGKTLSAIMAMEIAREMYGEQEWWYIGPRAAVKAVERELRIWKSKVIPKMMTYEGLVKLMKEWPEGKKAPQGVLFDEMSRVRNPTAQRSQAAYALANGIRQDWAHEGFVVGLSGSPAPKAPTDWWHLCEIACPGFLKEGTFEKFRNRLALIVSKENSTTGGVYPEIVSWLDSDKKCAKCGALEEAHEANSALNPGEWHVFVPAKNEVANLYHRMKGLVTVLFKKDCLDLPEKQYRIIQCKPKPDTLRAAKLIKAGAKTVIEGLTRLRELSDGFQYHEVQDGFETCPRCQGAQRIKDWEGEPENSQLLEMDCPNCTEGQVPRMVRTTVMVPCPKEDALKELLEQHEDVGRLVVYGGFAGTVDRIFKICQGQKWAVIRADGRGWHCVDSEGKGITKDPLTVFQDLLEEYPRVAFDGQPGAAGMGLTLTASPSIVYYSNDFNAESRIQSEDRIHRPGMDVNRGATIYDLIHLPSDMYVLDNLKLKRRLQDMTLTGVSFEEQEERVF